jgi:putative hemolysin
MQFVRRQDMTEIATIYTNPPATPAGGEVEFSYAHGGQTLFRRGLIRAVERLSGQPGLKRLYDDWAAGNAGGENPFDAAVRLLRLSPSLSGTPLGDIPRDGGLLIVANHPYGIIDGLTLGWLGTRLRGDARILTHALLCRVPQLRPYLLPVDFGPTAEARKISGATRRHAAALLAEGKVVVIFPGGSVATSNRPLTRPAADLPWHPFVGRLAQVPGVTTLPVFVGGQNSRLFQIASHLSYPMRLALIFHETRRRMGGPVPLTLGRPILPGALADVAKERIAAELRATTLRLGGADPGEEFRWPRHIRW